MTLLSPPSEHNTHFDLIIKRWHHYPEKTFSIVSDNYLIAFFPFSKVFNSLGSTDFVGLASTRGQHQVSRVTEYTTAKWSSHK